jgi:hypothetical protein
LSGAGDGGRARRAALRDDWATGIETWAATAHSVPKCNLIQEGTPMPLNEAPPAPETGTARSTATDCAVDAGERLLDMSNQMGNAYADAYQEAVINMADFRDKLNDAGGIDWRKLMPYAEEATLGTPLSDAAGSATRVNEQIVNASKQLGLAYVDAYEQAMLASVALHEQATVGTDNELLRSIGSVAREVTKAYVDAARQLLT